MYPRTLGQISASFTNEAKLSEKEKFSNVLGRQLLSLTRAGKLSQIEKLCTTHKEILSTFLNYKSQTTGRTPLHEACFNRHEQTIHLFKKLLADENVRDKQGFLPLELYLNPQVFSPHQAQTIQDQLPRQTFLIEEARRKLKKKKCHIEPISDITEIATYIDQHPDRKDIIFIPDAPNTLKCLNQTTPVNVHKSLIYFKRYRQTEFFLQLDSQGMVYLLPSPTKPGIERYHFYSPFLRQASLAGCLPDIIMITSKLFDDENLIDFCCKNAIKDTAYTSSPSPTERRRFELLKNITSLNQEEEKELLLLLHKFNFQKQNTLLKARQFNPITKIYQLTSLPHWLLPHIERFDTMRKFRTSKLHQTLFSMPIGQTTCLEHILETGSLRYPETTDQKKISENLSNPGKQYDFKGRSFAERHDKAEIAHAKYRYCMLTNMFGSKLEKMGLPEVDEQEKIIQRVLQFSGLVAETKENVPAPYKKLTL